MLIQLNRRLIIARRPATDLVADIVLALVEHAVGFPDHFVDLVWGLGLAIDIAGRNMDVKLQVQNLDLFQVFPDLLVIPAQPILGFKVLNDQELTRRPRSGSSDRSRKRAGGPR